MADIAGADAYFAKTTRDDEWISFNEYLRRMAVQEASGMIGCLSFLRRPPSSNLDNATYEQALCLLNGQDGAVQQAAKAKASGVKSRSVLDASESYASAAELENDPGWINGVFYCPRALMWLNGYVATDGIVKTGRVVVRCGY